MTDPLYRDDAYLIANDARVVALTAEGGVILDRSVFYPTGGGQPGDGGVLRWAGGECAIATAVKAEGGVAHIPAAGAAPPPSRFAGTWPTSSPSTRRPSSSFCPR